MIGSAHLRAIEIGAELIAGKWASNRKVPAVRFKPDFVKFSKSAAPFKRNDTVLEQIPAGVIHFPGGGIQDNLADEEKKLALMRARPFAALVSAASAGLAPHEISTWRSVEW